MKSLFRTIRQKLLDEGKLLRYLTYALGEIALIVVGILFALEINDWNDDREGAGGVRFVYRAVERGCEDGGD